MKLLLKYKSLLLAIVFLVLILFLMTNFADNRKNINDNLLRETEFYGIFQSGKVNLNQSYPVVKDSIDLLKDWALSRLRGSGESVSNAFISALKIYECDSCYSFDQQKFNSVYKNKYFVRLNGYTLNNEASFFIKNDKYYIRYNVWDSVEKDGSKTGHPAIKEIPVRYAVTTEGYDAGGALLIPISQNTYRVVNIVVWIISVVILLFLFYTLFALPARTLFSIADGYPFTKKNISRLYTTGFTLLAIPVIPALVSVITEWFFRKSIPHEIYYPFFQSILDHRSFLIAGLAVLLIANAFKKGYKLQSEQDLTV